MQHRSFQRAITVITTGLLAFCASLLQASAAHAEPTIQHAINAQLTAYPGGKQINAYEISYDDGAFVITYTPARRIDGRVAAGTSMDCPSGWFCFYEDLNYGYPRGKLRDCGWQALSKWGWQNRAESAQYNAGGHVTFLNDGTPYDTPIFDVGINRRAISDVAPYRNMADFVFHYC